MYENITRENIIMFAIKHYNNPQCEGEKEFHDDSFDDQDVNTHQAESYTHQLEQKKLTLTPGSSQPEVFNVLGQLETLKRVRQSGELKYDGAARKSISKKPAATKKS